MVTSDTQLPAGTTATAPSLLLVLLGLRVKGFVPAAALAGWLGLTDDEAVGVTLTEAAAAGFVQFRDGARSGWSLTAGGRTEGERLLGEQLDTTGTRAAVEACYRRFLALNHRMLAVCTDWQVKDQAAQVLNGHDDPHYDAEVITRLADIHAETLPICAELTGMLDRYAGYGSRLDTAITSLTTPSAELMTAEDRAWFTSPTIDSYHTVWFELHEDLLATLGIDRASERA